MLQRKALEKECNKTKLRMDQACFQLVSDKPVSFWSQYDECQGCKLLGTAEMSTHLYMELGTLSPVHYMVKGNDGRQICNGTYQFGEYGYYTMNVTEECLIKVTVEPHTTYFPILIAAVVLLCMAPLWYIVKDIGGRVGQWYTTYFPRCEKTTGLEQNSKVDDQAGDNSRYQLTIEREDNEMRANSGDQKSEVKILQTPARTRIRSLDVFRGIAVSIMIFVNAGGGGYDVFSHSVWDGITVADLAFPWFAFVMGESLVLSLNARLRTDTPKVVVLRQVVRRALVLSVLGIMVSGYKANWDTVRLPGVLQRLGAMYLIVGALECAFMATNRDITAGTSFFSDITVSWQQWLVTILLVSAQVCITLLVAAPGCPRGYTGPGGLHLSARGLNLTNCTGGIAGYIDRLILGPRHLVWCAPAVYKPSLPFDAVGFLGTIAAVLVVQAGAHAARVLQLHTCDRARITRWLFWALVSGVAGGALCSFSKDGGPIPINHKLCSLSFCLVCSSMALLLQTVLYYIVDVEKVWGGRPFYYAGRNSLFFYITSRVLERYFPLHWTIFAPTHAELLTTNVAALLIWFSVAAVLHRKRIYMTV